jgi:hypothetical protein
MPPTVATHAVRLHTESGFRRSAETLSLFLPSRTALASFRRYLFQFVVA